jgi:hypothetical protein
MKKSMFHLLVIASFLAILSTAGCSIFDDLTGSKDYGAYTGITFRIIVTYGGVNSEGTHELTVNGQVLDNSYFVYNSTAGCDESCSGAIYENPKTFEVTINSTSCTATQRYVDWIYWHYNNNGSNCKCMTTSYQASIISYTYEEGKDDPGSPIISGLEQLEAFENCTGNFSTDCETTVTLNFSSAYNTGQNVQSSAVDAVSVKQVCSPEKIE